MARQAHHEEVDRNDKRQLFFLFARNNPPSSQRCHVEQSRNILCPSLSFRVTHGGHHEERSDAVIQNLSDGGGVGVGLEQPNGDKNKCCNFLDCHSLYILTPTLNPSPQGGGIEGGGLV